MTPPDAGVLPTPKGEISPSLMANAIRALAMDAVQAANSGHPGMPMGMADVATVLYSRFLRFDPAWPDWPDRDRLVLSGGHGSMLLYALLYLTGYPDIEIDDIRNFRTLGGKCAGHPEYGALSGIETTTGPLGQGLGNGVGMALAEQLLGHRFAGGLVDHFTYVLVGDGDLMEGISHEAASLAGHLRLSKLIVLFDDNRICIDGPTEMTESDDTLARFAAYGWDVRAADGHDHEDTARAIEAARKADRPSLIACRTTIGYGAPNKQGTAATHGAALGEDEVAAARVELGWPHPAFEVPAEILAAWRALGAPGAGLSDGWRQRLAETDADSRAEFERVLSGQLPAGLDRALGEFKQQLVAEAKPMATRKASGQALEVITELVPEAVGGSADLTGSVLTRSGGMAAIAAGDFSGRYIYYGVREHAMAAAMNGMALHGGVIPYSGTFMVFTDYCRPAIRLSALMGLRVIYVMTHDSIGLGEDGPTHQPVEHLASLRAMPNLNVFRPADAVETAECWALALASQDRPSVLSLTRQGVAPARLEHVAENLCARGGYQLRPAGGEARVTLIGTGSEVSLALEARDLLQADGIATRVVSLPCWELFEEQDQEYRDLTLGPETVRIAVEAASTMGWERYTGPGGATIGMTGFGASAPAPDLYRHFGITAEAVAEAARERLG